MRESGDRGKVGSADFPVDGQMADRYPAPHVGTQLAPATGDGLQGAAADCNSAGETHAWFDSRVAHQFPLKVLGFPGDGGSCLGIA